jgi:PAS domain S-box-containing protein
MDRRKRIADMKNPHEKHAAPRREETPDRIAREWQRTFDADRDAIWILDKDQRIIRCNKMAQQIFNRSQDEMIGKRCWEITHGTAEPIPECPAVRVEKSLRRESKELQIDARWFEIYVDPILDDDGGISGFVHIVSDITDRKRAGEALRESEERFRKIFDEGRFGMVIVSRDFFFARANAAFCTMLGYSETELASRTFKDVTHPDHLAEDVENVTRLMKGEIAVYKTEKRYVRKDGGIVWGSATITAIRNDRGELQHFLTMVEDITERKRAEEALRESEEKFRNVFDNSAIGKSITYIDGSIHANPALCRMLGYTGEELSQKRWQDISHPDDVALSQKYVDQMLSGAAKFARFKKRYVKKDGSIIWTDVSTVLQTDTKGTPLYYITAVVDITEQRRMEAALHESEQHYRRVSELATDYIYKLGVAADRTVTMNFVSDNFYSVTGRTREDAMTVDLWRGIIHPDDVEKIMGLLRRLIAEPQSAELECRSYIHGHRLRWIQVIARSEWDEREGRVTAIVGAVKDITERKLAEEAIAAERERLAVTLRSIGDAVIATDVQGTIVLMNKVAETLTGWLLEEASGKPLSEVFAVVDELTREPSDNPVEQVLSSGAIVELANHTLLVSRDGTERIIADSGAPIRDINDTIIGVVLVFRDMTEKQKFMDAIQRTAKLDALGVLAGGIAHDFNNLLTGIFGYIDLIRSVSKDEQTREYLDATLAAMNRAKALTLQLMTFAKGGSPVQKITPLVPFVRETAQFALSGSNISCRFSSDETLWPCNIDKNQIGQVIDNIVINAQQAMPNGGDIVITAANISFGEREHPPLAGGDYVKISIRDFGIGIPKDILPRIFDPFYTTKMKGHGLGLTTCYSIVSRHGGCIDVESEPGTGSTFHVYLPASVGAVVADAARISTHRGSGTIIVVDDEEVVRDTLRHMLESMGYAVVCKNDGKEAIDFYIAETRAARRFSAMILDLTVHGGMGGLEAVGEIRKLNTEMPVFVTSGYADNSVMKDPVAYGFTASISKPFTIAELSELLNRNVMQSS